MEYYKDNPKLFEENAAILKAIAHPVRLCIVKGLLQRGPSNVTSMHSCLGMPQSTISQHLSNLKKANVIEGDRQGLEVFYRVSNKKVKKIIEVMF
ncbi:MAG: metalloregulator ArsR/SmtB family transcription factor [Anaeromicrobium sp.]|jgi:ArsR family transcriptional regulator|uniref:ArsR/SmtB family transcription factor n=1 Tax=Anaeromicrobium sp. TaxID=1929132 RepID=UPI0025F0694F|nr:metalloregulator ArsR/SmtB family transcription factor [Anaeromicrobium sp.]MCT4594398.1 metalloregulator ArsR/SmtB family transcription factor [Anaeromicrobium sp.]